jgi:hypothetical protein
MLDGYVERQSDGAMHHVSQSDPHSCFYSASRNIVEPINAVLGSEVFRSMCWLLTLAIRSRSNR